MLEFIVHLFEVTWAMLKAYRAAEKIGRQSPSPTPIRIEGLCRGLHVGTLSFGFLLYAKA